LTDLYVTAHVFYDYNLAIILIFAVLDSAVVLHMVVNWEVFTIDKCIVATWHFVATLLVVLCRFCHIAAYAHESCDLCSGKQTNTTFTVSVVYGV